MWQKNLVLNLVIGFFLFLVAFQLLMLGLFVGQVMDQLFPHQDHVRLFNSMLLYYFLADLFIRFLMQALPTLTIESFLHLPIHKGTIIRYMIGNTFFSIFNFLPLFILIPATFTIILPTEGGSVALVWISTLVILILSNNFLVVYLKRLLGFKPAILGFIGIILITLILLDRISIISLSVLSSKFFIFIPHHPFAILLPVIWLLITYMLQFRFLQKHLYPDEIRKMKLEEVKDRSKSGYLKSMGLTGSIMLIEFKLYTRNKRTKTMLYLMPIFLLYGLMFYPQSVYQHQGGYLIFIGIIITGGLMLNYANYAFGYESSYFDGLLTKNIDFTQYIRVKYYIAVLICTFCFIVTTPYAFYGYKILLINLSMYLYNIGIVAFVLLYFSTYNKRRVDLSRGGVFNYQGIGANNWLAIIPICLFPMLVQLPFNWSGHPYTGIALFGLLGVTGLFFMRYFLRIITKGFYQRKYVMAQSFREK